MMLCCGCNAWSPNSRPEMRCCLYSSGSKSAIRRSDAGKWPAFIKHVPNTNAPDSSALSDAVVHLKRRLLLTRQLHRLHSQFRHRRRRRHQTTTMKMPRLGLAYKLTRSNKPLTYASGSVLARDGRHSSPANRATWQHSLGEMS